MKTIEQAAMEFSEKFSNGKHHRDLITGYISGVDFAQRWIPLTNENKPEEGQLVLSAPCDNPQPHEIELCWYKNGNFISKKEQRIFSGSMFPKVRQRFPDTTHWRPIELK